MAMSTIESGHCRAESQRQHWCRKCWNDQQKEQASELWACQVRAVAFSQLPEDVSRWICEVAHQIFKSVSNIFVLKTKVFKWEEKKKSNILCWGFFFFSFKIYLFIIKADLQKWNKFAESRRKWAKQQREVEIFILHGFTPHMTATVKIGTDRSNQFGTQTRVQ